MPAKNGAYFGRFRIVSTQFGFNLRANADGTSVSPVLDAVQTSADFFSFLPVAAQTDDLPEDATCKVTCAEGSEVPIPTQAVDNASAMAILLKVLALVPVEVQILTVVLQGPGWLQATVRYSLSPFVGMGCVAVLVAHVGICASIASLYPALMWLGCPFSSFFYPAVAAGVAALLFMGVAVATAEAMASGDRPALLVGSAFGIPSILAWVQVPVGRQSKVYHEV